MTNQNIQLLCQYNPNNNQSFSRGYNELYSWQVAMTQNADLLEIAQNNLCLNLSLK